MKNKKGFTLVELVAVVAFIAIIILIATPNIINQIRKNKQTRYDNFVGDLCLAAEAYINHTDDITSFSDVGDSTTIPLGTLITEGYIKKTLTNPNTNERISDNDVLTVTINTDKTYSCEVSDN